LFHFLYAAYWDVEEVVEIGSAKACGQKYGMTRKAVTGDQKQSR